MGPFEIMLEEHRTIELVLSAFEKLTDQCEARGKIDAGPAREAIDFFRGFADRFHHAKEEDVLFPILETKDAFSKGCGPTAMLRAEHEHGRTLIRALLDGISDSEEGREVGLERFLRYARAYIALLRVHIHKEDDCLFPNANLALRLEEVNELGKAFERIEREEMGKGTQEKYLGIAESMADRYGIPRAGKKAGRSGHPHKR